MAPPGRLAYPRPHLSSASSRRGRRMNRRGEPVAIRRSPSSPRAAQNTIASSPATRAVQRLAGVGAADARGLGNSARSGYAQASAIARRGYRFVGEVRAIDPGAQPATRPCGRAVCGAGARRASAARGGELAARRPDAAAAAADRHGRRAREDAAVEAHAGGRRERPARFVGRGRDGEGAGVLDPRGCPAARGGDAETRCRARGARGSLPELGRAARGRT
jgi:hypothetical protein